MGRALIGLALIAIGMVILGDRADAWDSGEVFADWWPLIIVAIGVAQLASRPRPWLGAGLVIAVGLLLLGSTLDLLPSVRDVLWPSVLIAIGLWLVVTRLRGGSRAPAAEGASVVAIFGGSKSASSSPAFTGASVTAVFGEAVLDLRQALPAAGGAYVDATAVFGSAEVIVPRGWDVRVSGLPVLGGVEDQTRHDGPLADNASRLTVKGFALFGGVEVKHDD
jgi:hypothetical protein